ncbi:hypothetical protein EDB85DRAFT_2271895 [Lactarius pseudohatsudake]|nr:hypothetical protein EDB85DRAFT_2271895 [Lactarius pseudohatsudake]
MAFLAESGDIPASGPVVDDKTGTQYSLHLVENLRELNVSEAFSTNGAITFAGGDIEGSVNTAFDFSQSHASTRHSILIVLRCERHGHATRIGNGAKLAEAAKSLINKPSVFRERFGDYYVHEISHEARFTAVWKCTSQSESTLMKFKSSIGVDVDDARGPANFESQLKSAAKESNVSIEVQYDVLGDLGSAHIDVNASVTDNLALFATTCVPVPSTEHLRHYCIIEPEIPRYIDIDPDLYLRTRRAFDDIRLAVLFNSTLPADENRGIVPRNSFQTFQLLDEPSNVLNDLAGLLEEFHQILACHELITSLGNVSYDDAIRGHPVDHTDGTAAWKISRNTALSTSPGALEWKLNRTTPVGGSLAFPGGTGVDGIVIGFTVNSDWMDGTNGWWGIVPKTGPLGKKDLKVSVQSDVSRGMHWSLDVWYIPTRLYN